MEIDARLIERDFGEVEGLTRDEFDFYAFWNSKTNKKFARAETIHDVEVRVFDLLNELAQKPQDDVLLVSHAGVGCVLLSYFKGVPKDGNYLSFEIPNGSPLKVEFK